MLNDRLHELREAGIAERAADGYRLTDTGRDLLTALEPLDAWAKRWSRRTPQTCTSDA